jgi:predicted PurR-regulated permease PerM
MERGFLLALLVLVTLAFAWLIGPFTGAILWGFIAAVLFAPINALLLAQAPERKNLAAGATLLLILAVVVLPALVFGAALISQAASIYAQFQSGELDFGRGFVAAERHLPKFALDWLASLGLGEFAAVQERISSGIASSVKPLLGQVVAAGQGTLAFFLSLGVMLYLTFFLLRDGDKLTAAIERCLPLPGSQRALLVSRFVTVVRATVKGSLIVAVLQGLTGGITFWALGIGGALLWGLAMGLFSLFPAIGTGLVWVPVTIYLLASGDVWRGGALFLCGFFIISMVDNVVRPVLVGRDAQLPDFVVLIATLGGFELMGFNGFVIGPLIAAIFMTTWEIYGDERAENRDLGDEVSRSSDEKVSYLSELQE